MIVALVGVVALAAACLQATAGIGFALVLTPVLLLLISPPATIITVTVLGLELNLLVLFAERRRRQVLWRESTDRAGGCARDLRGRDAAQRPVASRAAGGGGRARDPRGAGACPPWGRRGHGRSRARRSRTRARGSEVGGRRRSVGAAGARLATGVLTTSTGVSGPPLALWLTQRGLSPAQLRDSLSASFLAFGAVGALALAGDAGADPGPDDRRLDP